ncbi:OLC1v1002467C1 [Oldenlandia corymbosa var. corymbosa]|uniref:OLC1v1002467C1 n=1 Tax=Oldenlandia corymbosa var. corymbosa TaxID=529605 RepID=A0AAV1D7P6_OLDCO|nr:OLC1v1002467C1 [Oldenlandia corymbosa var. corymbosa]
MNTTFLSFSVLLLVVLSHHHCNGLKEDDKIDRLPGQPYNGVDFNQYSGYVPVNPEAGRAFFYYFVESSGKDASWRPLVLWLTGGVFCSSIGIGAFTEIGPFRVNEDSKTLDLNQYAWNQEANILFVDNEVGVGFSYSNTSSDYQTYDFAASIPDTYAFLVSWLQRFPEYKDADVFLAGEGYSGNTAIHLGQFILQKSKYPNQQKINLKGIAVGNAFIDKEADYKGFIEYDWSHNLVSEEIYMGIKSSCNFNFSDSNNTGWSDKCQQYLDMRRNILKNINVYDIYSPLCNSTRGSNPYEYQGPCSTDYVSDYFNNPDVQIALHANLTVTPYPWSLCNYTGNWSDYPDTALPAITELVAQGIQILIYNGDLDTFNSITSAKYAIDKLGLSIVTPWYQWYHQNEVSGFVIGYENLVFASVRGGGHFVPASQPARALELFTSFVTGLLPPSK